jgi:small subunit ribosomal protein S6
MREYETVVITKPDLAETQFNQTGDKVKTIIEKHDGHFFYARDMGRKSLSYPIRKNTKGVYTCFDYAAAGQTVSEIERALRIDDGVLRFLTVVKREDVDVEARAAEIVARGENLSVKPEEVVQETKVEVKAEVKSETKAETKVETEIKVEEKVETKTEEKADEAKEPGKGE